MKQSFLCVIFLLMFSFSIQAQEAVPKSSSFNENTTGMGMGIQYGVFGFNVDANIIPNLNLTWGIGYDLVGAASNIGAKYFFFDANHAVRPRVLAVYGTNTVVKDINSSKYDKEYYGLSVGFGALFMWSRTCGIDLDIMYVATTGIDVNDLKNQGIIAAEPSKVKISIGLRIAN